MDQQFEALAKRQTDLEMLVMHLQQTVQALDEVIRRQHDAIDRVQARLSRLEGDVGQLRDTTTVERRPEDEKPPHY